MTGIIKLGDNWQFEEDEVSGNLTISDRVNTNDVLNIEVGGTSLDLGDLDLDLAGNSIVEECNAFQQSKLID